MDVFSWNESCETGLIEVDKQHHHLFDVINDFGRLLARNQVQLEDIESLFAELVDYTVYHFTEEVEMMESVGVDQRHIDYHKQEHQSFLDDVVLLHGNVDFNQGDTGRSLFEFLINWLVYHILGLDMNMSRQVAAIRNGAAASQAYLAEEQALHNSTDLLLTALTNLFQQVSSRNKELIQLNQSLETKVAGRTAALLSANKKLEELAATDALTGLPNRRFALQWLLQLWEEAEVNEQPIACMLIDADNFKQVNDNFGHDAGDLVLQELAKQLTRAVRTDDQVCRLGGDEFLIICPNTDEEGSLLVADNVHAAVAALTVPFDGGQWDGSISVGVAVKTAELKTPDELIKRADNGVYAAKAAGRNCVKMIG